MRISLYLTTTYALVLLSMTAVGQDQEPKLIVSDAVIEVDPNAPIEIVEERYEDGRVQVRREVTLDSAGNYVNHGAWASFAVTGEEVASGKYSNNKRDGVWRRTINWGEAVVLNELPFTEFEAPFISQAEFKNGQLDGKWTITDSTGKVASDWTYVKGQLDGTAKWYYPDSSLREEITYSNGLLNGTWKLWDQDGTELTNETYQDGRKLAVKQELHPNGVIMWEGMFLHETFVVKATDDWWLTRPVTYTESGKPERHGRFTSWYNTGQKKLEGIFEHEAKAGEFTWWHPNTQKAVQGAFKDNERHGVWSWWHENGQKAIHGQYDNGKLNGKWSYWNADGKLERKTDYTEDGEPIAVNTVPVPNTSVPTVADTRAKATEGSTAK